MYPSMLRTVFTAAKHAETSNFHALTSTLELLESRLRTERHKITGDELLAIEAAIYQNIIREHETLEVYEASIEPMEKISNLAAEHVRVSSSHQKGLLSGAPQFDVVVCVHSASVLAHVDLILTILTRYRLSGGNCRFLIVCLVGRNFELERRCKINNFGLACLDLLLDHSKMMVERLGLCLELTRAVGAKAIVQLSLPLHLSALFCASKNLLPSVRTVWLALKYKSFRSRWIDLYASAIGPEYSIDFFGQIFSNIPFAPEYPKHQKIHKIETRSRFGNKKLMGTIGRVQKLKSREFLNAIRGLLATDPSLIFLYTAKISDKAIADIFEPRDFVKRAIPIGWVKPEEWVGSFDIFVDSFPFPCGYTIVQALSYGVPFVTLDNAENQHTGIVRGMQEDARVFLRKSGAVISDPSAYEGAVLNMLQKPIKRTDLMSIYSSLLDTVRQRCTPEHVESIFL